MKASEIGQLVMDRLKDLDKVAYVRFASVYREFRDVLEFKQELEDLSEGKIGRQPFPVRAFDKSFRQRRRRRSSDQEHHMIKRISPVIRTPEDRGRDPPPDAARSCPSGREFRSCDGGWIPPLDVYRDAKRISSSRSRLPGIGRPRTC